MIKETERRFAVSTDSSGVLGLPSTWREVYGFLNNQKGFVGFEAIGWRWVKGLLTQTDSKIMGVHGRMGGGKRRVSPTIDARSVSLNQMLVPTCRLTSEFPQTPYVLIHSSEAKKNWVNITKWKKINPEQTLFIENDLEENALATSVLQANRLGKSGINTGLMFDLGHHLFDLGRKRINLINDWDRMIQHVDRAISISESLDRKIITGIHLPIGSKSHDSIEIDSVNESMWTGLRNVLEKYPQTLLVIENQQAGCDLFYLTKARAKKQKFENERKFEVLHENGIIPE